MLHERFQTWQKMGLFDQLFQVMVQYYARECRIGWKWQAGDSKMVPAPLGGPETGKNPTDRGKSGAKIHVWVDTWGAPLALHLSGTNQHDKFPPRRWVVERILGWLVKRRSIKIYWLSNLISAQ